MQNNVNDAQVLAQLQKRSESVTTKDGKIPQKNPNVNLYQKYNTNMKKDKLPIASESEQSGISEQ